MSTLQYKNFEMLIENINSENDFDLLQIECSSIKEGMDVVMSNKFQNAFYSHLSAIGIFIKFNEKFDLPTDSQLSDLVEKYNDFSRSILISFQSNVDYKFFFRWRVKGKYKFLTLEVTENYEEDLNAVEEFLRIFLISCLVKGESGELITKKKIVLIIYNILIISLISFCLAIVPSSDQDELNSAFTKINNLSDLNERTVLMIAAECGNISAVKYFIKYNLSVHYTVSNDHAIDFAYRKGHFEIVMTLLQANSLFPREFDPNNTSDDIKIFLDLMNDMHDAIKKNDGEKVLTFLQENPHLRYFFNSENETAIGFALKLVSCDAYEVLMLKNLNYQSAEDYINILNSLSLDDREKIRQLNFKHTRRFGEKHIIALMGNSTVVRSKAEKSTSELLNYVHRAFNILDNIPRIRKVLELTANYKNLQIVFDFENEILQFLDPTANPYDNASFYYNSGQIGIAAKKLLDPDTEHFAIGALAHELCHLAMLILHQNMAKPYSKNDIESELEYEEIKEFCYENKDKELIIQWVFGYDKSLQHAELAVRVVHILAHYNNKTERTKELEECFNPLFENFNKKIMPEMQQKINKLDGIEEKLFKKKISLLWKFIIALAVLVPIGIIVAVLLTHAPTFKFSELSNEKKIKFLNSKINFHGADVKFIDIFGNDSIVYDIVSSEHIKYGFDNEKKLLSDAVELVYIQYVFLTYSNMTQTLRNKFVTSEVDFQGEKVVLNEILDNFNVLNSLNTVQIRDIFVGHKLNISRQTLIKTEFLIDRFFIDENAKVDETLYKNNSININHESVLSVEKVFDNVVKSKYFILSDFAGEGKTTIFRNLAKKFKQKFPKNWIQFVELKNHFEAFDKGTKINLKPRGQLFKFLSSDLMNLNTIESQIFTELLNKNRVVFFWDGIDELSTSHKDFILNSLIQHLSNCSQFISTRPQYSKEISVIFGNKTHKLIPFGRHERVKFLTKSIKFQILKKPIESLNLTISQKITLSINKAETILNSFEGSNSKDRFLSNPLMLRMISEIAIDENYFGMSNLNLYSIFDTFIDKKLEIFHLKGQQSWSDVKKILKSSSLNVMLVHQASALKYMLQSYFLVGSVYNISNLEIMKQISTLTNDQVSRYGILNVDSENYFKFTHQSFAEFLVARFFVDNIDKIDSSECSKKDTGLKLTLFDSILHDKRFVEINHFLLDFNGITSQTTLEVVKDYEKLKNITKDETVLNFLSFMRLQNITKYQNNVDLGTFIPLELAEFTSEHFDEIVEKLESFVEILGSKKFVEILSGRDTLTEETLLHRLACSASEKVFKKFLENLKKCLSGNEVNEIISIEDVDGNNSFMIAAKYRNLNNLKSFWKLINETLSFKQKKNILLVKCLFYYTVLHYSAMNKDPKSFMFVRDIYDLFLNSEEIKNLLTKNSKYSFNFLKDVIFFGSVNTSQEVSNYFENLFKSSKNQLKDLLSHRDESEYSIFSWFSTRKYIPDETKIKLNIFVDLLRKTFNENQNEEFKNYFKALKISSSTSKVISVFSNEISTFFQNLRSNRFFSGDFEFFLLNWNEMQQKFGEHIFKNILMSVNNFRETFLHELFARNSNELFIEPFLEKVQNILNKSEVLNLIFVQDMINNETSLGWMVQRKPEYIKIFWQFIENNLNLTEKEEILLIKNDQLFTSLQISFTNVDPNSFKAVKKIYETFFTKDQIREILNETLPDGLSFIYEIFAESSTETALEVSNYLEILFKDEKLKLRNILSRQNLNLDSIYSFYRNEKLFEQKLTIFTNLLRKTFDEEQEDEFNNFLANLQLSAKSRISKILKYNVTNFDDVLRKLRSQPWSDIDFEYFLLNSIKIDQIYGIDNLKHIITSKDGYMQTLIHDLVNFNMKGNFFESFLNLTQRTLNVSEIKNLIFAQNKGRLETSLMLGAKTCEIKELKIFWKFVKKNLNETELGALLLIEQLKLLTALQYSTSNKDSNSFEYIKNIYEFFFTTENIRIILSKLEINSPSFIFNVINDGSFNTTLEVSNFLENLFQYKKIELRQILSHRDSFKLSIFTWFKNRILFKAKLNVFKDLLRKSFEENENEEFVSFHRSLEEKIYTKNVNTRFKPDL